MPPKRKQASSPNTNTARRALNVAWTHVMAESNQVTRARFAYNTTPAYKFFGHPNLLTNGQRNVRAQKQRDMQVLQTSTNPAEVKAILQHYRPTDLHTMVPVALEVRYRLFENRAHQMWSDEAISGLARITALLLASPYLNGRPFTPPSRKTLGYILQAYVTRGLPALKKVIEVLLARGMTPAHILRHKATLYAIFVPMHDGPEAAWRNGMSLLRMLKAAAPARMKFGRLVAFYFDLCALRDVTPNPSPVRDLMRLGGSLTEPLQDGTSPLEIYVRIVVDSRTHFDPALLAMFQKAGARMDPDDPLVSRLHPAQRRLLKTYNLV
jgi:hypothetical protein